MENLRRLLGEDWVTREVLCADPRHVLGRWYKKSPDNVVTRHVDALADFILHHDAVRCDAQRLATKLKGEFADTLVEMDYAVFLGRQGFQVTMEPFAPNAGPDLLAVRDVEYFLEIRRVRLDEARAAADTATEDVFRRLCETPSRYSVIISMTDEYSAHSPRLKLALKTVRRVLRELSEKRVQRATLYYRGMNDYDVSDGEEREPDYDFSDRQKLAAQLEQVERARNARFVARFDDAGEDNPRTVVAVHPLGPNPHLLKPDETYLRLRDILKKKREQLPKASRGIIVFDVKDLEKLMVDQETFQGAVYGDLVFILRGEASAFESDLGRACRHLSLNDWKLPIRAWWRGARYTRRTIRKAKYSP
jgi:hypothetical protein